MRGSRILQRCWVRPWSCQCSEKEMKIQTDKTSFTEANENSNVFIPNNDKISPVSWRKWFYAAKMQTLKMKKRIRATAFTGIKFTVSIPHCFNLNEHSSASCIVLGADWLSPHKVKALRSSDERWDRVLLLHVINTSAFAICTDTQQMLISEVNTLISWIQMVAHNRQGKNSIYQWDSETISGP